MSEPELLFIFFFILGCAIAIYPPDVIESCGFTFETVFRNFLGSEKILFTRYHQRRTAMNVLCYSSLPGMFLVFYKWKFVNNIYGDNEILAVVWDAMEFLSGLASVLALGVVGYWSFNNWSNHPITRTLAKFSNNGNAISVADDISNQFRRANCFCIKINPLHKVIATDSWIIKTTPFGMFVAHQSDTTLVVEKSEIFDVPQESRDSIEMVTIKVQTNRPTAKDFYIRINILNFSSLQDNLNRRIIIPPTVKFQENIIDRFITVFKDLVVKNPIYQANQIADKCFGCLIEEPNIKLNKQCLDIDENEQRLPDEQCCKSCYCRPMWCVDCFARWFAARQNDLEKRVWLQQKCTCPLCRAKFCLLDVCYIEKTPTT